MTCLEDTIGCEAWTWTDENNQDGVNQCWMFSRIGVLTTRRNCVREGSREFQRNLFYQLRISSIVKKKQNSDPSNQWSPNLPL